MEPQSPYPSSPSREQYDEIDIRELILILLQGWHWILATLTATLLAAVGWLIMATPGYSTEISYADAAGGLSEINRIPGIEYEEDRVMSVLARRLRSYEWFRRFLNAEPEAAETLSRAWPEAAEQSPQQLHRRIVSDKLSVSSSGDDGDSWQLRLSYPEGLDGTEFLNRYFEWSVREYTRMLASTAEQAVEDRIEQLKGELEVERETVTTIREDRIRELERAEAVAEELELQEPKMAAATEWQPSTGQTSEGETGAQSQYLLGDSLTGPPLYLRGVEALRVERRALETDTENNTPTPAIRLLERDLDRARLYSNIRPERIQLVDVMQRAHPPTGPDQPRRALTLALALILGLMAGVMVVFLVRFIHSFNEYRRMSSA